jgi:hypothetical protein
VHLGLRSRWSGARNQAAMRRLPVVHLLVAVNDRLSLQATAGAGSAGADPKLPFENFQTGHSSV